ncbi:sensor histidine kinase [Lysobacter brunescens]|uniref:Sensor histidine kinase n=1 Tax=Lysobacter brunescens TaxID=262323 RepID=A0ABW2YH81_9GAMM
MTTPALHRETATPADGPLATGLFSTHLLSALNIAAYVTWLAIAFAVLEPDKLATGNLREWLGAACLLGILALYMSCALAGRDGRNGILRVLGQGALILAAEALLGSGQNSVLLIIVAGQLVLMLPLRAFVVVMLAFNAGLALIWLERGVPPGSTLISLAQIGAFQAFAALTGHYAGSREQAREHLAQVNAELMATRRLLEESARAGERLKLSRELHDVAGHSLTALKLNLARLARDPALAKREEIVLSAQLADDLLAQIRQVVGALRAHDGLDLRAALQALGRPVPGVRIDMDIEDGLRVDDIDQAETLLRCAQEAITNALRHGRARHIRLRLQRDAAGLALTIDNDGLAPSRVDEGNGLTGMRERLGAIGGRLEIEATPPRGLRVVARIEDPQA